MRSAVGALHHHGGGGGYTGPLDIVSGAVVAYGQRALSAAKRGSALYTIREDAGDTTQSFDSDATTGAAPVAAITTFLAGANGFVTTWNDQSGNGSNGVQATSAKQPAWEPSVGPNNLPALLFDDTANSILTTAGNVTLTAGGAYTIFAVILPTRATNQAVMGFNYNGGSDGNGPDFELLVSPAGGTTISLTTQAEATGFTGATGWASDAFDGLNAYQIDDCAWEAGSGAYHANGTLLNISDNGYSDYVVDQISWPMAIGNFDAVTQPSSGRYKGEIVELIVYATRLSAGNITSIRQNIASAYGITLP